MKIKKVRPVLVEIKDASNIFENNDKILSFYEYKQHASSGGKKFELILISLEDERIEVGNEYLDDCALIREAVTSDEDYWKRRPDYKKVISRQSQISPEYISKFIEQYNKGCVEDLEIEMEKYFNKSIGDKVEVINNVYNFSKGDLITIKQFNYKNDYNLIEFEEDDEYQQGFHISHLNINSKFEPKLTNGFVTIVEKEPIIYTEEEVRKLISEALYHFCPMNNYREEDEIDWFEKNKKK